VSVAICDQKAFYPLRSLIAGPLTSLHDLVAIERFVRTVVLHDEISMENEPWPYDPDSESEFTEEEQRAGGRNVIVAIGPTLTGYNFFTEKHSGRKLEKPDIILSPALTEVARKFSNAEEGNVYYKAHVEHLQRIVCILQKGGSALLGGEFGSAAIDVSSKYPDKLFENLDRDWQHFAREANEGKLGFVVPPVLSIILTRCAKRDAIPTIIKDLRDEWAEARAKVWTLLDQLKTAQNFEEGQKIQKELAAASLMLSPASHEIDTQPVRILWELFASSVTGATTALISGGRPDIGAVIGAIGIATRVVPLLIGFGPALFGLGAFDLARRIKYETMYSEYDSLAKLLTDAEKRMLGL
jgi:hypothetical protein